MSEQMVKYNLYRVFARKVMSMRSNDFEKMFSDFLDRREYDQAENALFSIVRIAFAAGWKAAGGDPPQPQKIFQIIHRTEIPEGEIETDIRE